MTSRRCTATAASQAIPDLPLPAAPTPLPSYLIMSSSYACIANLDDDDDDYDINDNSDDGGEEKSPPPIPTVSSSSAFPASIQSSTTNHRCPFRPHPAAAQCTVRSDTIEDVATHYLREHVVPGKTKADDLILQQLPPLGKHTCPTCKLIYNHINKHTRSNKCRSSASRYTKKDDRTSSAKPPRLTTQRVVGPNQRNQARPPTHSSEHPLPLLRPQTWEHIPHSQLPAVIDLVRPGLTAYANAQLDDLNVKTSIITDLHRFPSLVLNKVRTDHGKAERSLGRRVTSPELQRELFAEFRHLPPAAGATAATTAPPAIEVWTDGSSKPVEGKGKVAEANRKANNKP